MPRRSPCGRLAAALSGPGAGGPPPPPPPGGCAPCTPASPASALDNHETVGAVDGDGRTVWYLQGGEHRADDGRYAELARDDGAVRQRPARVGHQRADDAEEGRPGWRGRPAAQGLALLQAAGLPP